MAKTRTHESGTSKGSAEVGSTPHPDAFKWARELTATILDGVRVALGGVGPLNAELEHPAPNSIPAGPILRLRLGREVRGEIATKSRVPVEWVMDPEASFTINVDGNTVHLNTDGLFALPFEDGLQTYADSGQMMPNAEWNALKDEAARLEAVREESKRIYDHFERHRIRRDWTGSAIFYGDSPAYLEHPRHKLHRCWHTIREFPGYRWLVGHGLGAFGLLSMLLTPPLKINGFDFAEYDKKTGVRVAMRSELDLGASHGLTVSGQPAGEFFQTYRLDQKTRTIFDPNWFPIQRMMAEKFAESAMSYAAAQAAGDPQITAKNGGKQLEGGKPDRVIRFFSACTKPNTLTAGWQRHDLTWQAQGSEPGRVVWRVTEGVGPLMGKEAAGHHDVQNGDGQIGEQQRQP